MIEIDSRSEIALAIGEAHIWRVHLDQVPATKLAPLLSRDETARAERFHSPLDRTRFIVARGALRHILSHYLSVAPQTIAFSLGKFGKPYLPGNPVYFNISHSGPMLLVAVSRKEIGVDLECIREEMDVTSIADSYFTPEEAAELHALAPDERCRRFFELWTNKEAACKAHGIGIAYGLDTAELFVTDWCVRPIPAPSGYMAAVALPGYDWTLQSLDWHLAIAS